jgi:bestrophin-3
MPQVPEVLITAAEAPAFSADSHQHDSTTSILSLEFTGVQPSGTEQQVEPSGTPPGDPNPQTTSASTERDLFKFEEDLEDDRFPKRWSLPEFLESRHTSLGNLGPDPVSPRDALLLPDTETPSETNGIHPGAGSALAPDILYLMESLDKETDILEFNNEHTGESPKGTPQRPRTWF